MQELILAIVFRHFEGINFCYLGFNKDFTGIKFPSRNFYKDFAGSTFHWSLNEHTFPRPYFVALKMISVKINTFLLTQMTEIINHLEKTQFKRHCIRQIFPVPRFLKNSNSIIFVIHQFWKFLRESIFAIWHFRGSKKESNFAILAKLCKD